MLITVIAAAAGVLSYTRIGSKPRTTAAIPSVTAGEAYFVGGHVDRPGAYVLSGHTVMLRGAMEEAGASRYAGPGAYVLITRGSGADAELIKADLAPLLRDGRGDEPLLPGDQVLVYGR